MNTDEHWQELTNQIQLEPSAHTFLTFLTFSLLKEGKRVGKENAGCFASLMTAGQNKWDPGMSPRILSTPWGDAFRPLKHGVKYGMLGFPWPTINSLLKISCMILRDFARLGMMLQGLARVLVLVESAMACWLEVAVPSRRSRKHGGRKKRSSYTCRYAVSHFELFDFVNRVRGKVRVYYPSHRGEYSVIYPAKWLLLNPVPDSWTMIYFYCQNLIYKLYTDKSIDDIVALLS